MKIQFENNNVIDYSWREMINKPGVYSVNYPGETARFIIFPAGYNNSNNIMLINKGFPNGILHNSEYYLAWHSYRFIHISNQVTFEF